MFINLVLLIMCLGEIQAQTAENDYDRKNEPKVGAYRCSLADHNYMVAILYTKDKSFNCGGSLIAARWVITTRLCMQDCMEPSNYMVVAGVESPDEKYWGKDMQSSVVKKCYWRELFDIGLVHLHKSIKSNNVIGYLDVGQQNNLIVNKDLETICKNSTTVGWATKSAMEDKKLTSNKTIPYDPFLKCFNAPAFPPQDCQKILEGLGVQTSNMKQRNICTFRNDTSVCIGDRGSPLVCKGHLFAMVSYGFGCSGKGFPVMYVKTYLQNYWISSTMMKKDEETERYERCEASKPSFLVGILRYGNDVLSHRYICGGSLLTETWVLTSGVCTVHCEDPNFYTVVAGLNKESFIFSPLDKNILSSKVAKCYQCPTHTEQGDLALMKLKTAFHSSPKISFVKIATSLDMKNTNFEKVCNNALLMGYSRVIGYTLTSLSNAPRCQQARAISNHECQKKWWLAKLADHRACLMGPTSYESFTVVGAPLVCNGIQYGVLTAYDCQEYSYYDPYMYLITKVYKFEEFLQNMVYVNDTKKTAKNKANRNINNPVNLYIFIFFYIVLHVI